MVVRPTPAIIGFGVREGALTLYDALTRKPSRPQRLLEYLLQQTTPDDPVWHSRLWMISLARSAF